MADDDLSKLQIDKTKMPLRRGKRKRFVALVLGVMALATAVVLYSKGVLSPAVQVQVAGVQTIYPSQTLTLLNASGYVVAQRKAAVAAKITGRLVHLAVEEGSRVKSGEVIARLENDDTLAARERALANLKLARMNLEQAKIELDDASRAYKRRKQVVGKGIVSEAEYDAAEARLRNAQTAISVQQAAIQASEAALKEAEVSVGYAYIRAPFDAVVLTKNADIGDIVTPLGAAANAKAAVVTIADMSSLQVEADVSESSIEQVKRGQPCEIQLDAFPEERFQGIVHMIVPTADRSKASVMVKVRFVDVNPKILPEMSARVAFLSREILPGEREAVKVIPSSALIARDGRSEVFVIEDGRAVRAEVRVGRRFDTFAEVLSGVEAGEKVIAAPDKVEEGSKVKIPAD